MVAFDPRGVLVRSKVRLDAVVNRFETLVELLLSVRRAACIRHWPWVTIALAVLNLLSFVLFTQMDRVREQRLAVRGLTALVYFQQHPYLALKAPLDELVEPEGSPKQTQGPSLADVSSLSTRATSSPVPVDHALLRQQQAELDGKVSAFAQVAAEWSTTSLGYVPRDPSGWTLITYQFMHGSWLHVLGNICFLCLVGAKLERTWGRIPFVSFYLASGVAAASAHQVLADHSAVPLIGASGAIAGLLGAVTSRCLSTRTRLTLPRSMHWHAWRVRAPLLIVVWFALELTQALLLPRREGSVAHFAHVGGFIFGFLCAGVMRVGGFERPRSGHTSFALE